MAKGIKTMAGEFKSIVELQGAVDKQVTLVKAKDQEIAALKREISHLRLMLTESATQVIPKPEEEIICEREIGRLNQESEQRMLTLEEVKQLDLLVKNLKIIKEQKNAIPTKGKHAGYDEAKLIEFAQQEDEDELGN